MKIKNLFKTLALICFSKNIHAGELFTVSFDDPQSKEGSFYGMLNDKETKVIVKDHKTKKEFLKTVSNLKPTGEKRTPEEEKIYQNLFFEVSQPILTQNILMFSGGYTETLRGCISLSMLERIINAPLNAHQKRELLDKVDGADSANRDIFIADLFSYGFGSSLGAIPIALYFYRTRPHNLCFSAEEIARIFSQYLSHDQLSSKRLEQVTQSYAGNFLIKNAFEKHGVFLYGNTEKDIIEFTNCQNSGFQDKTQHLENTPLFLATTACAISSLYPININTSAGHISCHEIKERPINPVERVIADIAGKTSMPSLLQLFSFGKLSSEKERQEKMMEEELKISLSRANSPLIYYASSKSTVIYNANAISSIILQRIIQDAFVQIYSPTFSSMVKHLGFQMPNQEQLKHLENDLSKTLNALEIYKLEDKNTFKQYMIADLLRLQINNGRLFLRNEIEVIDENNTVKTLTGMNFINFLKKLIPLMKNEDRSPDEQAIKLLNHFIETPQYFKPISAITSDEWGYLINPDNVIAAKKFLAQHAQKSKLQVVQTMHSGFSYLHGFLPFFSNNNEGHLSASRTMSGGSHVSDSAPTSGGSTLSSQSQSSNNTTPPLPTPNEIDRSPSLTPPPLHQPDQIIEEWDDMTDQEHNALTEKSPKTEPKFVLAQHAPKNDRVAVDQAQLNASQNNGEFLTKFYEEYLKFISTLTKISPLLSLDNLAKSYLDAKFEKSSFLTRQDFQKLLNIMEELEAHYQSKKLHTALQRFISTKQSKTFSPLINALKNLIDNLTLIQ